MRATSVERSQASRVGGHAARSPWLVSRWRCTNPRGSVVAGWRCSTMPPAHRCMGSWSTTSNLARLFSPTHGWATAAWRRLATATSGTASVPSGSRETTRESCCLACTASLHWPNGGCWVRTREPWTASICRATSTSSCSASTGVTQQQAAVWCSTGCSSRLWCIPRCATTSSRSVNGTPPRSAPSYCQRSWGAAADLCRGSVRLREACTVSFT